VAAAGVPTRLGGKWYVTTTQRVLAQPRHIGVLVHNGVELGRTDAIEPVLDEMLFRRMVERLTPRGRDRPHLGTQLLTGVLVCGVCGGGLNSNTSKKSGKELYRVYGCRADGQCNIKGEAVEAIVVEKMFERLSDRRFAAALSRTDKETASVVEDLRAQNSELDSLKAHAARHRRGARID